MAIVPAGKLRIMQAQNMRESLYDNPQIEKPVSAPYPGEGIDSTPTLEPEVALEEEPQMEEELQQEESKERKTLSNYIFKKLESFGYPGRRLEEFKKKFVNQDISPEGTETIRIEIPDKKYPNPQTGKTETIESDDLYPLVKEINKIFGLNFNGASRAEGRWTINFTSEVVSKENDEEGMVTDNLDEVYGQPSKGRKPKAAFTIEEMIKKGKNNLVDTLKKVIGEKNAQQN